jgi:hypothetical protein
MASKSELATPVGVDVGAAPVGVDVGAPPAVVRAAEGAPDCAPGYIIRFGLKTPESGKKLESPIT